MRKEQGQESLSFLYLPNSLSHFPPFPSPFEACQAGYSDGKEQVGKKCKRL